MVQVVKLRTYRPTILGWELSTLFAHVAMVIAMVTSLGALKIPGQILFVLLTALVAAAVLLGPSGSASRISMPFPTLLLFLCLVLSFAWSYDLYGWRTGVTTLVPVTATMVIGSVVLDVSQRERAMLHGAQLLLVLQVYALVAHPAIAKGVGQQPPGWHGTFTHKNSLGNTVLVVVLIAACLETRIWRLAATLLWGSFLLLMSQSRSSQVAMALGLVVMLYVRLVWRSRGGRRYTQLVLPLGFAIPLGIVAAAALPFILQALGKDASLTGRTEIWPPVIEAIAERPVLGYGYSSTFRNPLLEPTATILRKIKFFAFHPHNSYLDIALSVGLIGLFLYFTVVADTLHKSVAAQGPGGNNRLRVCILATLVPMLVLGFSESNLLKSQLVILIMFSQFAHMQFIEERGPLPQRRWAPVTA